MTSSARAITKPRRPGGHEFAHADLPGGNDRDLPVAGLHPGRAARPAADGAADGPDRQEPGAPRPARHDGGGGHEHRPDTSSKGTGMPWRPHRRRPSAKPPVWSTRRSSGTASGRSSAPGSMQPCWINTSVTKGSTTRPSAKAAPTVLSTPPRTVARRMTRAAHTASSAVQVSSFGATRTASAFGWLSWACGQGRGRNRVKPVSVSGTRVKAAPSRHPPTSHRPTAPACRHAGAAWRRCSLPAGPAPGRLAGPGRAAGSGPVHAGAPAPHRCAQLRQGQDAGGVAQAWRCSAWQRWMQALRRGQ